MKNNIKDCIREIQELLISINEVVKKYDLEDEFISAIAVGFVELDETDIDENGDERARMSLLSSVNAASEDELDDVLSYVLEIYQEELREERKDTTSIDYWINLARGDDSVN